MLRKPKSKNKSKKLINLPLTLPKTDVKKEREAQRRAFRIIREINRDECLRLDGCQCRNPFCDCSDDTSMECAIVDSHHILGKTRDNRWDGVKFRISLSRRCHTKYDKDREGMMKILRQLKKTVPDFRWGEALKGLEEKWYLK